MIILPVSSLASHNIMSLNFNNTNTVHDTNKQVTLNDIPYSYPITFGARKKSMRNIQKDSRWAKNIFEQNGISAKIDEKDGLLTISNFREPSVNAYF